MKRTNSMYTLVVIDFNMAGKKMCIAYHADIPGTDFLYAVETFFEDAGIEVDEVTVEKLASEISRRGFAVWEDFHFELMPQ